MTEDDVPYLIPSDSAWLTEDDGRAPLTIAVMFRLEGMSPSRLMEFLERYWLKWERFTAIPVKTSLAWRWEKDPAFALRHHVRINRTELTEASLPNWVSDRLNDPLPDYRPRWRFWLASVKGGPDALLLRIHHCYGDGLSLMGVFEQLSTPSPMQAPVIYGAREGNTVGRWKNMASDWVRQRLPSPPQPLARAGQKLSPRALLDRVSGHGYAALQELQQQLEGPADTIHSAGIELSGRRLCRWSEPVPMERINRLCAAYQCTINDLVLASITAGARAQIHSLRPSDRPMTVAQNQGESVENANEPPSEVPIYHAAVPMDIRRWLPGEARPVQGSLGNYFGTVFLPLPVHSEGLAENITAIRSETRKMKSSLNALVAWTLAGASSYLPPEWRSTVRSMYIHRASAVVSNVASAPKTRFLAGCRIVGHLSWVPQAVGAGITLSVVSYAGQLQIGLLADESVLADPDAFLNECLAVLMSDPPRQSGDGNRTDAPTPSAPEDSEDLSMPIG